MIHSSTIKLNLVNLHSHALSESQMNLVMQFRSASNSKESYFKLQPTKISRWKQLYQRGGDPNLASLVISSACASQCCKMCAYNNIIADSLSLNAMEIIIIIRNWVLKFRTQFLIISNNIVE